MNERLGRLLLSLSAWLGYLFLIIPTVIVVPVSFGNRDAFQFPPDSLSIHLYRRYFLDPIWMAATKESLIVAAGAALLAVLGGTLAAYGLARSEFRGKQALVLFLLSPLFVPSIVIALGLYLYFGWLRLNGSTSGLILAHALITLPFVIVTILSGLRHVDPTLERAAHVMGATRIVAFVKITLPLIKPSILASALFGFLISFDELVIAYFLTSTSTQTLPVKMYSAIRWEISPVLAAVATLLTAFSFTVCIGTALLQREQKADV